ncbi:MAG: hypothetical protein FJ144_14020 [Deltaproteobacteria bacterium]|nr:hypothetical protein [Deltaproteobacteria bacterium]
MTRRSPVLARAATALASALVLVLSSGTDVRAQNAGVQLTPDSRTYLISKDFGVERWSISVNLDDRTITGNVFETDGSPPSFIWCEITSILPSADPAQTQYTFDCLGSDACSEEPCTTSDWRPIGSGLVADGDFILPDGTQSTLSGNVQPIFDRSCAFSLDCHAIGGAGRLDLARDVSWAATFLVPARQAVDPAIFYVDPFRTDSSYLLTKVLGNGFGSQMPLGLPPLPPADIDAITRWIVEGAANN